MDMHGFFVAVFISKKCMEIGVWREFFWGGGRAHRCFQNVFCFRGCLNGMVWMVWRGGWRMEEV